MPFVDWIVVLAIALLALVFFGRDRQVRRPLAERARRRRGMRLLAQATIALWAALLTLQYGLTSAAGMPFGGNPSPQVVVESALILMAIGVVWLIRGGRLLRQRWMFRAW